MIADVSLIATLLGALVVFAACAFLVFHPAYDDGFLGRLGLSLVAVVAAARILRIVFEVGPAAPTSLAVMLYVGLALFLTRHTTNFLRRSRNRDHTWYAPQSPSGGGKRPPLCRLGADWKP